MLAAYCRIGFQYRHVCGFGLRPCASICPCGRVAGGVAPSLASEEANQDVVDQSTDEKADPAEDAIADTPSVPLASALAQPSAFVSEEVSLEGEGIETVIGSFTLDGLTYAVIGEGEVELSASASASSALALPEAVSFEGASYTLTSIADYAFYLTDVESLIVPSSVSFIGDKALRAPQVQSVETDANNSHYATYDSVLYDADLSCLLSIPGGRQGAVRIASQTAMVDPGAFSHCAQVDAIAVDADSAAFSSEDGLLYDADMTTLVRVPAGATDIVIADGCTAIAPGAMEGCAKLASITAPASVTSISPYVFSQEPEIVSLPVAALAEEEPDSISASDMSPDPASASSGSSSQISSVVALTLTDDSLPEVDPASIEVVVPEEADYSCWQEMGFESITVSEDSFQTPIASGQSAATSKAVIAQQNFSIPYGLKLVHGGNDPNVPPIDSEGRYTAKDVAEWGQPYFDFTTDVIEEADGTSWVHYRINCLDEMKTSTNPYGHAFMFTAYDRGDRLGMIGYKDHADYHTFVGGPDGAFRKVKEVRALTKRGDIIPPGDLFVTGSFTFFLTCSMATLDDAGGSGGSESIEATYGQPMPTVMPPTRSGWKFMGYFDQPDGQGRMYYDANGDSANVWNKVDDATLYACWKPYTIDFDTSSEPGDSYPGDSKDPITSDNASADGTIAVTPPTRPGYIFQGWVPEGRPNDEELLGQDEDGNWYVNADQLPDYADSDGKVSLTARWTAAISVDAPLSATFMYDLSQWDGAESRDAMVADDAEVAGAATVKNRSAVPIRVSGLESKTGNAANVLKKGDTTLADVGKGDEAKVLSVFPTTADETGTEEDAKGAASDAAGDDLAHKVDLSLSEVKLESDFDSIAWAIDAGATANGAVATPGELKLGYRLNLGDSTGVTLDRDALLAVVGDSDEGQTSKAASIADLTYCFAAELAPSDWDEPLWIENPDRTSNPAKYLLLSDIKEAANDLSANGTSSAYYDIYKGLLDAQMTNNGNSGTGPYFQLKVDGVYLPLQLIGICQDAKSNGTGKAGLTFQMRDVYAFHNARSDAAGGGAYNYTYMNSSNRNAGGWGSAAMRAYLRSTFWGYLPEEVKAAIDPVDKYQQLPGGTTAAYLQKTTGETVWLPSVYEVFGAAFSGFNESEALSINGHAPFQYMAYQGNAGSRVNAKSCKLYNGAPACWWVRSATRNRSDCFCNEARGDMSFGAASTIDGVAPAFCL